jgi:uncharacterized sulfatase
MLFDLNADPWEIHNLAASPEQSERLATMRDRLKRIMIETHDTGVVPETMWPELTKGSTIHDFVASPAFDHAKALELAFLATSPEFVKTLEGELASPDPVHRYWAAMGCVFHGKGAAACTAKLKPLLEDPSEAVRAAAAKALTAVGG